MGTIKIALLVTLCLALLGVGFYAGFAYSGKRIASLTSQRDAFEAQLKQQTSNLDECHGAIDSTNTMLARWQDEANTERARRQAEREAAAAEARRLQERVRELLGRPMPADCCGALEAVYARQQELIDAARR